MTRLEASALPTCPHCHSPLGPTDTACGGCGADLSLLALAAADNWHVPDRPVASAPAEPLSLEQLVPRLGDYLVQQGYVTEADLQAALAIQAQAGPAERRRLGRILVDLGRLDARKLDQAIAGRLHELQTALLDANRELEQRVADRTAELETALRRLTEFNQLKANLVANISHELRTPLTHIKGYTVLLLEGGLGTVSPDQHHALRITSNAVERLEQLINDLIAYADAARGELTLHLIRVNLPEVVHQAVERSRAAAHAKKVKLVVDVPASLPPVEADPEKLLWTVHELVANGLKFTPAGGQVSVRARPDTGRVRVEVSDTGIGIPGDRLDDIFEAFRQLDGSSTRRYGGTGLGLALARRILEAHGTTLEVRSEEGQGSIFSFALVCAFRQSQP